MLLSDLPTRWPYAFLDQENTPGEARVAMEKSALQAGPDLAVSNMVPREIDLGAPALESVGIPDHPTFVVPRDGTRPDVIEHRVKASNASVDRVVVLSAWPLTAAVTKVASSS